MNKISSEEVFNRLKKTPANQIIQIMFDFNCQYLNLSPRAYFLKRWELLKGNGWTTEEYDKLE